MSKKATDELNPQQSSTSLDTFKIVGNEIRAEIIQTLGEISVQSRRYRDASFSELHSRMESDIDTSQVNYHLKKLLGQFVMKGDEGYRLRPAGIHLFRAIRAGKFSKCEERTTVDAGFNCHNCQNPVVGRFEEGYVKIKCPECGSTAQKGMDMAASLENFEDLSTAFHFYGMYHQTRVFAWANEVCHVCGNSLDANLIPEGKRCRGELDTDVDEDGDNINNVIVLQSCNNCGFWTYSSVGGMMLTDPGLVKFCYDHGVELFSTPIWELEFVVTPNQTIVRSTNPWEIAVQITCQGETLEIVVNDKLHVVERNRLNPASCIEPSSPETRDIEDEMDRIAISDGNVLPEKEECLQVLRRHRWPDGVSCPHCNGSNTTKKGMTKKDTQRYRCQDCECVFNDLTGTIFGGHRFSLPEMFYMINSIGDMNSAHIARQLDRSYQSVLNFVHEVQSYTEEKPDSFNYISERMTDNLTIPQIEDEIG